MIPNPKSTPNSYIPRRSWMTETDISETEARVHLVYDCTYVTIHVGMDVSIMKR